MKKLFTGGSDTFSEENSDNQNVIYKMDSFTYNFNAISYMKRSRSYFGLSKIQITDDVCNWHDVLKIMNKLINNFKTDFQQLTNYHAKKSNIVLCAWWIINFLV